MRDEADARVRNDALSLRDILGAHAFGADGRRRRGGAFRRNRGGSLQGADRTRAGAWRERPQADALAGVPDRRPRPARRGVAGRFDDRARIYRRRGRSAAARRRLSGRSRLHARSSTRARRRDALGGDTAQGRRRHSPRQRLRQRMRQARCDGGDFHRDRDGLRSHSWRQGRRSAGAARPVERRGRAAPRQRGREDVRWRERPS